VYSIRTIERQTDGNRPISIRRDTCER
jgi:hypothetical protein